MNLLPLALILFLSPLAAGANDSPRPNPPTGHVLDHRGWLPKPHVQQLETELSRLRTEHHVDVLVIVWNRTPPPDNDLEALARHLGQTWARENLWAVVLQVPDNVKHPVVAYEGAVIDTLRRDAVDQAIRAAVDRGVKEWTEPDRLASVALGLGEELVYLRLRRQHEQDSITAAETKAAAVAKQQKDGRTMRTALGVTAALLLIGGILTARILIRRRGPARLTFPDTRWRRRLGAPWCGGGDLVTTFTPPHQE
jgi:hypothetical protein